MSKHLTPYEVVERMIGRPEKVGPAIGLSAKTTYLWRHPSKTRDAGDIPSTKVQRALLDYARAQGLPLTAQDLIYGANAAEIEARLQGPGAPQTNTPAFTAAGVACGASSVAPILPELGGGMAQAAPAAFPGRGDVQAGDPPAEAAVGEGGAMGCALPSGAGVAAPAPEPIFAPSMQGAA